MFGFDKLDLNYLEQGEDFSSLAVFYLADFVNSYK